jgi:hypothetical protein
MSGQFPLRLSPSGPFTETVDDAGLGGIGYTGYANIFPLENPVDYTPNDPAELLAPFYGGKTIPLNPHQPFTVAITTTLNLSKTSDSSGGCTIGLALMDGAEEVATVDATEFNFIRASNPGGDPIDPCEGYPTRFVVVSSNADEHTSIDALKVIITGDGNGQGTVSAASCSALVRRIA